MNCIYKYSIALVVSLLVALSTAVAGSPAGLHFAATTNDLGNISEDGGVVTSTFVAVNKATEEVIVSDIYTSCGCTKASYKRGAIAPGEEFHLGIAFDPMNRPGRIDKYIYVHTSAHSEPIVLRITGYVEPRERTAEELYPFDMGGGLRLESNYHTFGYVEEGRSVECGIGYINTAESPIELSIVSVAHSGRLDYSASMTIGPHATGNILLRYTNSAECPLYGIAEDRLQLVVDGTTCNYEVATHAIMVDNFDMVDDISAPRLAISKNIIKFGEVNDHNEVIERSVELRNEGATPLVIRAIEVESAAVEVRVGDIMSIAPGQMRVVTFVLRSALIEDWDNPLTSRALVITNDPLRPMQTIRLTALPL